MSVYAKPDRVTVRPEGAEAFEVPIAAVMPRGIWLTGALPAGQFAFRTPAELVFHCAEGRSLTARAEIVQWGPGGAGLELCGGREDVAARALLAWSQDRPAELSVPRSRRGPRRPFVRRGHILVVEDDASVRTLLTVALGKKGFRVRAVENVDDAIHSIARAAPDAILLDWMLPRRSGDALLGHVRDEALSVPVAVLSGVVALQSTRVEIQRMGAEVVIPKPFSVSAVVRWVEGAVRAPSVCAA